MGESLSYLVVDNPAKLIGNSEGWSAFRRVLQFRHDELSPMWPAINWISGADMHCTHCAVLYENRIAGIMRIIDPSNHPGYDTVSPVFELISHQEHAVRAAVSENLNRQIKNNPGRLAEFGQLVIGKEFRGTKLGLKTQLRRRVNALTVRTAIQLGFTGMFALSREEANTIKIFSDFGTRFLGEPDRIFYKNNTESRVIICDGFTPEFMAFVDEIESDVASSIRIFSNRIGEQPTPSTRAPVPPLLNEPGAHP